MIELDDLRFIDALSRTGSLSAAARSLNVTPPALSMRLKRLERLLNINLVVRSSRHLRFTSEGERLVSEAHALLDRIDSLPGALAGEGKSLAGRLHVVSPFGFGRLHISPLIARFVEMHPSVHITLDLSERPWTESKTADVAIHIGVLRDSTWIVHRLARNERWACASPEYLRRRRCAEGAARPAGASLYLPARKRRGRNIVALSPDGERPRRVGPRRRGVNQQ